MMLLRRLLLVVFVWLALPAWAGIVQQKAFQLDAQGPGDTTVSMDSSFTAGNAVVVVVAHDFDTSNTEITSITAGGTSLGNEWHEETIASGSRVQIYQVDSVTGGTADVVINWGTAAGATEHALVVVFEIDDLTASPRDAVNTPPNTTTQNLTVTTTTTPVQAREYAFGVVRTSTSSTITWSAPTDATEAAQFVQSGFVSVQVVYAELESADSGPVSVTFNSSASSGKTGALVTLKREAAPGGSAPSQRTTMGAG